MLPDSRIPRSNSPALASGFGFAFVVLLLVGAAATPNGGGSPSKRAGAPDDGDGSPGNSGTCADVGCHESFDLNSGPGSVGAVVNAFYAPGDTLDVEVFVDHEGAARHGFQITARDASGAPAGEWIPGSTSRLTIGNPDYVTQKLASSVNSWPMKWVAPADATAGDVTFYFAGNGADGRFNAANDHIYTGQTVVALSTAASVEDSSAPRFVDRVYPNPARNSVNVRYASAGPVEINIYDIEGRLRERKLASSSPTGTTEERVDVSALPSGVYIVELESAGFRVTQPVFVQR